MNDGKHGRTLMLRRCCSCRRNSAKSCTMLMMNGSARSLAECFLTAQAPGRGEEAWNSVDFCKAFPDAFDFGKQSRGRPFSMYLRTAVRHAQAHDQQQEEMAVTGF